MYLFEFINQHIEHGSIVVLKNLHIINMVELKSKFNRTLKFIASSGKKSGLNLDWKNFLSLSHSKKIETRYELQDCLNEFIWKTKWENNANKTYLGLFDTIAKYFPVTSTSNECHRDVSSETELIQEEEEEQEDISEIQMIEKIVQRSPESERVNCERSKETSCCEYKSDCENNVDDVDENCEIDDAKKCLESSDPLEIIRFFQKRKVIATKSYCEKCRSETTFYYNLASEKYCWHCTRKDCHKKYLIKKKTFFEDLSTSWVNLNRLMYDWCIGLSIDDANKISSTLYLLYFQESFYLNPLFIFKNENYFKM
jgi:hypothetical protein